MILAQILADSINPIGRRITTWLLTYPRFIHAEFMTHRDFSRNAASSRAIPLDATLRGLVKEPALPVWWGSHQKGMASGPQLEGGELQRAIMASHTAMEGCIEMARMADLNGLHKSITNRWLEPWTHIRVVATATDHRNFFALRAHPMAQPEFQVLAYRMLDEYMRSQPRQIPWSGWHIPFGDFATTQLPIMEQVKVSVARACWTSYNKPDKVIDGTTTTWDDAFNRHDESVKSGHWSPFEHPAQAVDPGVGDYPLSNFDTGETLSGWYQYRKTFKTERNTTVDLAALLANRPEWTVKAGL